MRLVHFAILVSLVLTGRAFSADRPNFVFVFADDQRYDAMSCVQKEQGDKGRFPFLKTPNMDRLAAEGVRFRNAFVVNSLCSPSRACFLTGKYSHSNGIWNNQTPFPKDAVTHASLLKSAGYRTGYVGKWHMGNQPDRPGFDWYASFTGQGTYEAARFLVNGTVVSKPGWVDDQSADYANEFITANKDHPFLLVVGFKATHGPFQPPARLNTLYEGELARSVPNYGIKPGFNPEMPAPKKFPQADKVPVGLGYMRCVSAIDENLGRVLDTLDKLKLSDNTVVVYSSDNGFYHGEHSLADKRSGYDESLRIPFIVRYPRLVKKNATHDAMVLNIDLAPSFLDLAGVPIPKEIQGRSWKPLLSGGTPENWRQSFFYEYFREAGGKGANNPGGFNTPTMTAVRTPTAKLTKYLDHDEWTEVFDLAGDPYELKNLANDPKHAELRKQLEAEHTRLVRELGYFVPKNVPKKSPPPTLSK